MNIRMGVALVLVLGLAGCGGGGKDDKVASAGKKPSGNSSTANVSGLSDAERTAKYIKCMRDQGIAMQDPTDGKLMLPDGTDPEKAKAGDQQCKAYAPNGGEQDKASAEALAAGRKMSKCMREHGLPSFPDPDESGGVKLEGELNPNSDQFKAAQTACEKKLMPGDKAKKQNKLGGGPPS